MGENNKNKARLLVCLAVLILIALILILWFVARPGEAEIISETDSGPQVIQAGSSAETQAEQSTENGGEIPDDPGDPQKQDSGIPDDGIGAQTSLAENNTADITLGIDVSKWQGQIDWQQVADSGVDFAIIRVGYRTTDTGEICEDPYAAYNLQHASEAGIQLGAYFFSTAVTEEEAVEEALWTADFLAGYPITYPVAYNCEGFLSSDSRMYSTSTDQRTRNALAFLDAINERGYEAIFHASAHDLTDEISWDTARIAAAYPIWVAQYPSVPYPDTESSSYAGAHTMWQYTSQGSVPGIQAHTDLNVAYFRYEQTAQPQNPGAAGEAGDVLLDSSFTAVDEMVTAKDVTNLRDKPTTVGTTVMASIQNGEWVRRIGVSSRGWSQLDYNGQTLYAISSLLLTENEASSYNPNPDPNTGDSIYESVDDSVTAKIETNLRDAPSTEGTNVVATIQNGEWVRRTGIGSNGWSRLDYNGQTLYALTSFLTTDSNFDPEDVDSRNIIWTETSDSMTAKEVTNLRDKPTTGDDSQVIATIYNGDVVERTAVGSNGWSRVVYNGQTLYAVTSFLTPAS